MEQIELNFEAGLTDQFPDWPDVISASVYSCGKPFKNIAADLDMSPSLLSRMLSPSDSINFPAHRLADLIQATGDLRPIYWLVEKYCGDPQDRKRRLMNELSALLPKLNALLKDADGEVVSLATQARG